MAIQKLTGNYFGVVELTHVAAVKTGQIKAQFPLDATQFANAPAQNGMLLVVDEVEEKIKLPSSANDYVYLHASVEKDYTGYQGRKHFAVKATDDFYPRLYKLNVGDRFETNTVKYDDAKYSNYAAIVSAITNNKVYGVPSTDGFIQIVEEPTGTEKVVLKVVKGVVLPNDEVGFKFVVVQANNFEISQGN